MERKVIKISPRKRQLVSRRQLASINNEFQEYQPKIFPNFNFLHSRKVPHKKKRKKNEDDDASLRVKVSGKSNDLFTFDFHEKFLNNSAAGL